MKRFLAIALVFVLGISVLSACGNSASNTSDSGAASATSAQTSAQPSTEKVEPVTISILQPGTIATDKKDFNTQSLPELVKEKFPNVTVNSEVLPGDQFVTTLKAKLASGEGPDLYSYWPKMQAQDVIKPGYAKDITGLSVLSKFNKNTVDAYADNGKDYAIPSGVNVLGVYYNKDMFAKAGITAIPQDWSSFLDACKKLKDANIQPIVSGDKDGGPIIFGMYQMAANLIYPAESDFDAKLVAGKQHFTDPKWIDVLTKYKKLYDSGYIQKNSLGTGNVQAQQLFIDGKAAMTFDGNWGATNLLKKGAVDFEKGFFPLPGNDSGKPVALSAAPSTGTFINAQTKNYDTIVKILEYWYDGSSPLFNAWVDFNVGQIPAYNGLEFKGDKVFGDFYKLFQSNQSWYFCDQAWPSGVGTELCNRFQMLIGGKATVDDVAKGVDAKVTELINQKN